MKRLFLIFLSLIINFNGVKPLVGTSEKIGQPTDFSEQPQYKEPSFEKKYEGLIIASSVSVAVIIMWVIAEMIYDNKQKSKVSAKERQDGLKELQEKRVQIRSEVERLKEFSPEYYKTLSKDVNFLDEFVDNFEKTYGKFNKENIEILKERYRRIALNAEMEINDLAKKNPAIKQVKKVIDSIDIDNVSKQDINNLERATETLSQVVKQAPVGPKIERLTKDQIEKLKRSREKADLEKLKGKGARPLPEIPAQPIKKAQQDKPGLRSGQLDALEKTNELEVIENQKEIRQAEKEVRSAEKNLERLKLKASQGINKAELNSEIVSAESNLKAKRADLVRLRRSYETLQQVKKQIAADQERAAKAKLESLIEERERELKDLQERKDRLIELSQELTDLQKERDITRDAQKSVEDVEKRIKDKTLERENVEREIETKTRRIEERELERERLEKERRK